jgi:glutamate synthase (NADPH/NADH) large chain
MVELEALTEDDREWLYDIVRRHRDLTESTVADRLLFDWSYSVECFRKVMPRDYKRVLTVMREAEQDGLSDHEALGRVMVAAHG